MLKDTSNGTTHHEGCWRSGEAKHLMCALQTMKDILAVLPDNLEALYLLIKHHSSLGFAIDDTHNKICSVDYVNKKVSTKNDF